MKISSLTRKLPYLIIFSILLFVITGCNNLSKPESSTNSLQEEAQQEDNTNPVFRALAANIDE